MLKHRKCFRKNTTKTSDPILNIKGTFVYNVHIFEKVKFIKTLFGGFSGSKN